MPKPGRSVLNVRDMDTTIISASWEQCSKCEGYGHYDYQYPSESHVNIVLSGVDDSKVVEGVHVHSEICSVIEGTSIDPCPPILNEIPMSSESTIDVVDAFSRV